MSPRARRYRVAPFVLITLLAGSLAHAAPPSKEEREAIEALVRTYEQALTDGNVTTILRLYSSDPVFMPEYAAPAVGRDAVRKAYTWVFETLKLNGVFHIHEIDVNGYQAWARTSSTGRFTIRATGVEAEVGNNEFFLFRLEAGEWRIHRYLFNANKPLGG